MLYSEAITEILTRADEDYTAAEERARQHFRGAIATLIRKGEYENDDLLTLLELESHTFVVLDEGSITIADIGSGILKVKKAFLDPEDVNGKLIDEASISEVMKYSFSEGLRPSGDTIKYYRVGKTIRFIPKDDMEDLTVYFIVVKTPPAWKNTPTPGYWDDTTDLLSELSFTFLMASIEEAKRTFEEETE